MNYYNEFDPKAAAWLRELIAAGHIAPGEVDERSIEDVRPVELMGFTQCHFFAGIGGWSYALRLAGWSDDRPVWTGSCPCQPFSQAGAGRGVDDERHLWPALRWLVDQCRPPTVFGEQVASFAGRSWLAGVRTDLETMGYRVGSADLCAAGIGAPHIRQRLYWLADAGDDGSQRRVPRRSDPGRETVDGSPGRDGADSGMADTDGTGAARLGSLGGNGEGADQRNGAGSASPNITAGTPHGGWSNADWLLCRDGKWRAVESGSFPLAHGVPGRVGRLRGYGNAIVPQVAAAFIIAADQDE